jgi:hypothetical protein
MLLLNAEPVAAIHFGSAYRGLAAAVMLQQPVQPPAAEELGHQLLTHGPAAPVASGLACNLRQHLIALPSAKHPSATAAVLAATAHTQLLFGAE